MVENRCRGNETEFSDEAKSWVYSDTKEPIDYSNERPCVRCKQQDTIEGHDPCLGTLIGVANACCGHGFVKDAYIQFLDDNCIRGIDAIIIQNVLKRAKFDNNFPK